MAAVTATATAGGTKDGRENFVLCNVELRPVCTTFYIYKERERQRGKKGEAEIEGKEKNNGFITSCNHGDRSRILKDDS